MVCKALASLDAIRVLLSDPNSISIHKALASLDKYIPLYDEGEYNFNPQGSREPRLNVLYMHPYYLDFNPQGSREPRLSRRSINSTCPRFQSTRLSRASTLDACPVWAGKHISIHKALASLDQEFLLIPSTYPHFNPQGSREPRPRSSSVKLQYVHFNPQGSREPRLQRAQYQLDGNVIFQSTRLSRAST